MGHFPWFPVCSAGSVRIAVRAGLGRLTLAIAVMGIPVFAQTATTATLAITSNGSPVTSIPAGTVVTLTATVQAGGSPASPGLVKFCDANAAYCEDLAIVGTAQITSAGAAVIRIRPAPGQHSYKAESVGTTLYAGSTSSPISLTVTGGSPHTTITTLASTGSSGSYTLTATVAGTGLADPAPSGTVQLTDTSNSNQTLPTATLTIGGMAFITSKVPSPLPSRMLTLLESELVTAISGIPSPLKSPLAAPAGPTPVG